MKVLVFGASGFVGFPVAQALSRAGHIVYGVTRCETKAKRLAAEEALPIIGDPTDIGKWAHLIPTIDVVIEALGGTVDLCTIATTLLNAVADVAQSTRVAVGSPKISYIYTSDTWIYGASTEEVVSDTTPLLNPIPFVAWRPAVEQAILKDTRVNGVVIRPAGLYGKSASHFDAVFEAAASDRQVAWYGKPGARLSLIHADDLADIYVRAAERAPLLGGLAIVAANDYTESVDEFLRRLIEVSGAKGPHGWIEPTNPFEEALASTVVARPCLAKSLLGWQQKKAGLTDGLPLYYSAWKASRGSKDSELIGEARVQ